MKFRVWWDLTLIGQKIKKVGGEPDADRSQALLYILQFKNSGSYLDKTALGLAHFCFSPTRCKRGWARACLSVLAHGRLMTSKKMGSAGLHQLFLDPALFFLFLRGSN
jgi:hypothetical protein